MADLSVSMFVFVLGLCIGSFLNVVIYRLPRNLSIAAPRRSFCPNCRASLRWYDNIPVFSWLMLGGRCRYCKEPISAQYPVVESVTGLTFVLIYHLLFVLETRVIDMSQMGPVAMAPSWPGDAALLAAWLVLAGVLISCSAMDLIFYVIDTRVTDLALIAGLVCYALWPAPPAYREMAAGPFAAAAAAAFIVSGVMMWLSNRRHSSESADGDLPETSDEQTHMKTPTVADSIAARAAIVVFVGLAVCLIFASGRADADASHIYNYLPPVALGALFVAMVLTGGQPRQIDEELHAAIEAEAPEARGVVLRELLWLAPSIIAAATVFLMVKYVPAAGLAWRSLISWSPIGELTPVGGLVFSMHGAVVAAAAGWSIRIFFTMAFGREAFGTGDIYILAAAGAVAGWDIALCGFVLSVPIALAGWIISLVLKRTGMIPFGPPLAIGFIASLWINPHAAAVADQYAAILSDAWKNRPDVVYLAVGLLLVVLPISIVLARLTRRLVEPRVSE